MKSLTAEPSRRNSGFDTTSNSTPAATRVSQEVAQPGAGADRHGALGDDHAVTIEVLGELFRHGASSATCPRRRWLPSGVPTAMKTTVAALDGVAQVGREAAAGRRRRCATPARAGRARGTGSRRPRSVSTRAAELSTQTTVCPKSARHAPVTRPDVSGADDGDVHVMQPALRLPEVGQRERDDLALARDVGVRRSRRVDRARTGTRTAARAAGFRSCRGCGSDGSGSASRRTAAAGPGRSPTGGGRRSPACCSDALSRAMPQRVQP